MSENDNLKSGESNLGERMKRRTLLGTSGAVAAGLAGCLDRLNGGSTETKTLHMLSDVQVPEAHDLFDEAFESWKEGVDVDVESQFEYVPSNDIRDTVNTRLSSGDAPDLIFTSVSYHAQFGLRGMLRDLTDVIPSNVPDSVRYELDGNNIYVPVNLQMCATWHRQDVYEEAGIEWASTWDEHLHNLEVLDDHLPDDQFADLYVANSAHPYMIYGHYHPMLSNGAQFLDRDSTDEPPYVIVDEEPYRSRTIEYLEFLQEAYQYSPESTNYGYGEATNTYTGKQVMSTRYPARLINNVHRNAPDLVEHTEMGYFPDTPAMQSGDADYKITGIGEGFSVPTTEVGSENPDLAEQFIDHFMSSDAYIDLMLTVPLHRVPANLDLLDTDRYQENSIVQSAPEYVDYIKDMSDNAVFYTQLTGSDTPTTYWDPLIRGTEIGPTMLAEPMVGRTDPEEAVDNAAAALREEIPKFEERFSQ